MSFPRIFRSFPPFSPFSFYTIFPLIPQIKPPTHLSFLSPVLCFAPAQRLPTAWSPFLVSLGHMLTPEDLELETTDEQNCVVFVFFRVWVLPTQ